jgi:hypothetical protein
MFDRKTPGVSCGVAIAALVLCRPVGASIDGACPGLGELYATTVSSNQTLKASVSILVTDVTVEAGVLTLVAGGYVELAPELRVESGASLRVIIDPDVSCPPELAGFGPSPTFVRVGDTASTSIPTPLTLVLAYPFATETFVPITSSDSLSLQVTGSGVTFGIGVTSVPVLLEGLNATPSATLTASLAGVDLQAQVRVVGASEEPSVVAIEPSSATIPTGSVLSLEVQLDIPASTGGTSVALLVTGAGSAPASVLVPEDQVSASFDFTAGLEAGEVTVEATLGESSATATLTITD